MTGTQNHEGIAGVLAAIDYLADLGRRVAPEAADRRAALVAAFRRNRPLRAAIVRPTDRRAGGVAQRAHLGHHRSGAVRPARADGFDHAPAAVAARAGRPSGRAGIFAWHGNFYALQLTETLGLEPAGLVRLGLLHYNTSAEIERLLAALEELE